MNNKEYIEICLFSKRISFIYLKFLRIFLEPSIFILDFDKKKKKDLYELFIKNYLSNIFKDNELIRCHYVNNFRNSMIPSYFRPLYLIYKDAIQESKNISIEVNDGENKFIESFTSIRFINKDINLIFILDFTSFIRYFNSWEGAENLKLKINEFLLSLKSILEGVIGLIDFMEKDEVKEKISIRLSVLFFGICLNNSWFQLILHEMPFDCLSSNIELIIDYLMKELSEILSIYNRNEEINLDSTDKYWSFELMTYLNSISISHINSLILLTNGVISSNIFGEKKPSSLICLNNSMIQFCSNLDINLHIVIINKFEYNKKDLFFESIPSIDTLKFIAEHCFDSTLLKSECYINKEKGRELALNLIFRSIKMIEYELDELEYKNQLILKEVLNYKISMRVSLVELLTIRLNNGFKFVQNELKIDTPLLMVSRFHKLIQIVCIIEEDSDQIEKNKMINIERNYDNLNFNNWIIKFFIKDVHELITRSEELNLIKKNIGTQKVIQKPEILNYNKVRFYLIEEISSYINNIYLLDNWFENLVLNYSFDENKLSIFPEVLNISTLPFTIRLNTDFILNEEQNLIKKDIFDDLEISWNTLKTKLIELGFNKLQITQNFAKNLPFNINDENFFVYYKIDDRMKISKSEDYQDFNIWNVLRSWGTSKKTRSLHFQQNYQINNLMIMWLIIDRFTISNVEYVYKSNHRDLNQTSIVKSELLFYGYTPCYCEEYFSRFMDFLKPIIIIPPVNSLSLIKISLKNNDVYNTMVNRLSEVRSWNYLLCNDESSVDNEWNTKSLNGRIISTITRSRYIDGWILLYKNKTKTNLKSSWFKLVDYKDLNELDSIVQNCSKLIFIYEISIKFEKDKNGNKLICKLIMINPLGYFDFTFSNDFSFTKFADNIQNQDNKIIHTTSLIEYLYTSSHLRKKQFFNDNLKDNFEIIKKKNMNSTKLDFFNLNQIEPLDYYNNEINKFSKNMEFNRYKRIIQNKSLNSNNNGVTLSIRDISTLFLTFYNNEIDYCSDFNQNSKSDDSILLESNLNEDSCFFEEINKEFIRKYEPLYSIEIPLVNVDNIDIETMNKSSKYIEDRERWKKYLEGAPENSLEKFLYKLSIIIDCSLRVDENEWYMILFMDENDLINTSNELNLQNKNNKNDSENEKDVKLRNQIADPMIITHIRLLRSKHKGLKSLLLNVYLCSYYNLSFGITNKKKSHINARMDNKYLSKIYDYVELYVSRIKDIWDSIKFKMIGKYYLLGIPICSKDIVRIQTNNEFNIDQFKYNTHHNNFIDSKINHRNKIEKEEYKYLNCNVYRFQICLFNFQKVIINKYKRNIEVENSLVKLEHLTIYMETELEMRLNSVLKLKLIHFNDSDLNNFLIFCGALQLFHGKSENVIVTLSLINNGDNLNILEEEYKNFWSYVHSQKDALPNTELKLNWFHYLIFKSLMGSGKLELKVTLFTSVDKKYIRVNVANNEKRSIINKVKEEFIKKLKKILFSWVIDMTMEQSFTHELNRMENKNEEYRIETFANFGRELLLECFQNTMEINWKDREMADIPSDDSAKNDFNCSNSIIFNTDIQFPLIRSSTKYRNYIAIFSLLSSQADYIPIKRKPNLILLWHGTQFPMELLTLKLPKEKIRTQFLHGLIDHIRILVEIFEPIEIEGNDLKLKLILKIYIPSSLSLGMLVNTKKKFNCRRCDFAIYEDQLEQIVSFLFSTLQSRFLDIWKEATCDFLLQNVTILKKVSSLIIPIFISNEDSNPSTTEKNNKGISILATEEQINIFGQITAAVEWLYEIPRNLTPNDFKRIKKNISGSLLKRELDPNYYEKPGEVVLWNDKVIEVPNYIFWLKKHDEIFVEIPMELYDLPLIEYLFDTGNTTFLHETKYTRIRKQIFVNAEITNNIEPNEISSVQEKEFINLDHPKNWLLYSEDVTITPLTLGTGSLFLIKPDYVLIDFKNKDVKNHFKKKKEAVNVENINTISHSSLYSKIKSKVGISLSFFGKRKPSKNTRIYFFKQLKISIQKLVIQWSHNNSIGRSLNRNNMNDMKRSNEQFIELSKSNSLKIEEQHITFIMKVNSMYHNFVGISIWNIIKYKSIVLNCQELFEILKKQLIDLNIHFVYLEKGIQIILKHLDQNSNVNIDCDPNVQTSYRIHVSFFSGINGRILDFTDPWAAGEQFGNKKLNLDSHLNDCFNILYEDDIERFPNKFWDFNKIIEIIDIQKNVSNKLNKDTESNSWNLIRDKNGRLSQIQSDLPIHLVPETTSLEPESTNKHPVYLMPCIYIGVDVYYNSRNIDLDMEFLRSNSTINSIATFVNSLLNLSFLELLLKLKITLKDDWISKDCFQNNRTIVNNNSFIINDDYYLIHGRTIRDVHKYKEDLQNFFQILLNNKEIIKKYSSKKIQNKTETLMIHYPTSTIQMSHSKGNSNEVQMYFPSWSMIYLMSNLRTELDYIEKFNKSDQFYDLNSSKSKNTVKSIVSGYSCIIHDTKEIDLINKILQDEDKFIYENPTINLKYPTKTSLINETEMREHGWHVLQYKSEIKYFNLFNNVDENEVTNWIDSLYEINHKYKTSVINNENDNFSIYDSMFNFSGNKQRPCITLSINSSTDIEGYLSYMILIGITPDVISFIAWDIPIIIKDRIEFLIKKFIYDTSIQVIWFYQLSIWFKFNKIYKKYIFILDMSSFLLNNEKSSTFIHKNQFLNDQNQLFQIEKFYPKICELPINLISEIWNKIDSKNNIQLSLPKDLFNKKIIITCKINKIKLEDLIIPNIEMGKIINFYEDRFFEQKKGINILSKYFPSVLNKIRTFNSSETIKKWNNYYFKYKIWTYINQFLLDNFSIKTFSEDFSRTYSKNIICEVSKSNLIFRYQQIINFLKKRIENYELESLKLENLVDNKKTAVNGNGKDINNSLIIDDNIIQTHYNILTYLQNSHGYLNTIITKSILSEEIHNCLLHPFGNISNISKNLFCSNFNNCELCLMNPNDVSLKLILMSLFICSRDIFQRSIINKKNEFESKNMEQTQYKQFEMFEVEKKDSLILNKNFRYKKLYLNLNSIEEKSGLILFNEEIEGLPYNLSTDLSRMFITKELTLNIDIYLKEQNFLRINYLPKQNNNKSSQYHISIINSILNGFNINEEIKRYDLKNLCFSEIRSENEEIIYLKTIYIRKYAISIPICLFLKISLDKIRILYLSSIYKEIDANMFLDAILNYIEKLSLRKVIFDYIVNQIKSLSLHIWELRSRNFIRSSSINSIDQFIDSIYWVYIFLKNVCSRYKSKLKFYNLNINNEYKLTHNQMMVIKNKFKILSNNLNYRVFSVPNSKNLILILFQSLNKNNLVGIIMDYQKGSNLEYNIISNVNLNELNNYFSIICFEIPLDLNFEKKENCINISDENNIETDKLLESKNLKFEVINTLKTIQQYIKRDQIIQKMQIYGSVLTQKYIEDLVNNYFSINLFIESNKIDLLPILKIESGNVKRELEYSFLKIREIIQIITSLFKKFWENKYILKFNNLIYDREDNNSFFQYQIISILLNYKKNNKILIRFFTTFQINNPNTMEWRFEKIGFTFKDQNAVEQFFLVKESANKIEDFDLNHQKKKSEIENKERNEIMNQIFNELIVKSIEYLLEYKINF